MMLCKRMIWSSFVLLLCSARATELGSTESVANAIGQLKTLIDTRLTQIDSELNKINMRLDKVEQFDSRLTQIDSKLNEIEQFKSNLNDIQQDLATMKDDTQLLFNPQMAIVRSSYEISLTCGVIGTFESCHWEHDNSIYQVDDVLQNLHEGLTVVSNTDEDQQCGIKIKEAKYVHQGTWTCKVLTSSGKTLSGTKTLRVIHYDFEMFNNRVVRPPKKTYNEYSTDKRMSYEESLDRCSNMGAAPFIPRTRQDFDFMLRVARTRLLDDWDSYMWFPATDINTEGHLMWADNTTATDSTIFTWCKNETLYNNGDNKDCSQIGSSVCDELVKMGGCHYDAFPLICEILP